MESFWKLEGPWAWLGNVYPLAPAPVVGLIITIAAVICGIIVGAERERREKPADMRTLVLICLGAAIFTQVSILVAGDVADRTRIAAQVVTGVGFLGAGAIIRDRRMVIGVTTGAAIWAVAAIGVVLGSGYVAAGLAFTLVVLLSLLGIRSIEHRMQGPCSWKDVGVLCDADGKSRVLVEELLHDFAARLIGITPHVREQLTELTIQVCHAHGNHKSVLAEIATVPGVRRLILENERADDGAPSRAAPN